MKHIIANRIKAARTLAGAVIVAGASSSSTAGLAVASIGSGS
jgi:hypothetical protein